VYADTDARQNQGLAGVIQTVAKHMGDRASYRQLFVDLLAYSKLSNKDKAILHSRSLHEIRTLVGCPETSRTEAIEGIIMQRFFGDSRRQIRRYGGSTGTSVPTQPTIDAVGKVIDTPELLESILSHLTVHTLVTSTRVSRTFRNVIHNSPTLLKNLFLLPQREPSDTITDATNKLPNSNERSRPYAGCRVATLCPLLKIQNQHFTVDKRFDPIGCEIAVIKPSTTWADSFTHMYLTNPRCTKVVVAFVYQGTSFASPGTKNKIADHTIHGLRTIHMEKGVTFDAIIDATYTRGDVLLQDLGYEVDDMRVKKNTTLHDESQAWHQNNHGRMCLHGDTRIIPYGVQFRTNADNAGADKVEKQLKMQNEQKTTFQKVLTELQTRGGSVLKQGCSIAVEK
jgi:hypothetical protein